LTVHLLVSCSYSLNPTLGTRIRGITSHLLSPLCIFFLFAVSRICVDFSVFYRRLVTSMQGVPPRVQKQLVYLQSIVFAFGFLLSLSIVLTLLMACNFRKYTRAMVYSLR
jgi:hypothetical protein